MSYLLYSALLSDPAELPLARPGRPQDYEQVLVLWTPLGEELMTKLLSDQRRYLITAKMIKPTSCKEGETAVDLKKIEDLTALSDRSSLTFLLRLVKGRWTQGVKVVYHDLRSCFKSIQDRIDCPLMTPYVDEERFTEILQFTGARGWPILFCAVHESQDRFELFMTNLETMKVHDAVLAAVKSP